MKSEGLMTWQMRGIVRARGAGGMAQQLRTLGAPGDPSLFPLPASDGPRVQSPTGSSCEHMRAHTNSFLFSRSLVVRKREKSGSKRRVTTTFLTSMFFRIK